MTRSSIAWAVGVLRRLRMPEHEIRAVLSAADPVTIHRHLELHAERLRERVAAQERLLAAAQRSLTQALGTASPSGSARMHPRGSPSEVVSQAPDLTAHRALRYRAS